MAANVVIVSNKLRRNVSVLLQNLSHMVSLVPGGSSYCCVSFSSFSYFSSSSALSGATAAANTLVNFFHLCAGVTLQSLIGLIGFCVMAC